MLEGSCVPELLDRRGRGGNDGMKKRCFRRTRMARLGIERMATIGAMTTRTRRAGRASTPATSKRRWWFMVQSNATQKVGLRQGKKVERK